MATASSDIIADSSTDANFRTWGSAISTALAAVGLTQASDTGQINWATVLKPTGTSIVMGYEIWRFSDALQATTPVYIKIEYGGGVSGAATCGLWFTVGTGTNGAGTLSGTQIGTRIALSGSSVSAQGAAAFNCFFSGSTNRITVGLWTNHTNVNGTLWFSMERSKDSAGADTSSGILTGLGRAGGTQWQYIPDAGGVPSVETKVTAVLTNTASFSFGTTTGVSQAIPIAGSPQYPGLNLLVYKNADFVRDSNPTVSVYGSNHVYWCLSNAQLGTQAGGDGFSFTNGALMLRYE